jgi:hypothetical protein
MRPVPSWWAALAAPGQTAEVAPAGVRVAPEARAAVPEEASRAE